jgi:hypothetical protein
VRSGFHELEAWWFLLPPFNLKDEHMFLIFLAQDSICEGVWQGQQGCN